MGSGARSELPPARRSAKCPLWLTLGLLALASAVTLWGFAYKVSLYTESSDPLPQVPVAKVWIEHRYGYAVEFRFVANDDKASSRFHRIPQPVLSTQYPLTCSSRAALALLPHQTRAATFFHSAVPLRSPPSLA